MGRPVVTRVRRRSVPVLLGISALLLLVLMAAPAGASGERPPQPPPGLPTPPGRVGDGAAVLRLSAPARAELGTPVELRATLTDQQGKPIDDVPIAFLSRLGWGDVISRMAVIGTATTDHAGIATLRAELRTSGTVSIVVRFVGSARFRPARASADVTVTGSRQLYSSTAGIRVPWLGIWLLAAVVGALWTSYLVVASRVLAIARSPAAWSPPVPVAAAGAVSIPDDRRRFSRRRLFREALPMGMHAYMAGVGGGLVTIIARGPKTHSNLADGSAALGPYRRAPVALVGARAPMAEMPAVLDRPVSFAREVLPIFLTKAGPHAVPPENSPSPGHVRLDSYQHIMASEGLVVPGKPEESTLVSVLLDPAMNMPPSGNPLAPEEIRLIVSWVAQGAADN